MVYKTRIYVFTLILMIFSGCANLFPNQANYQKVLNSYIGYNADELISRWGVPTKSYKLSKGGKVLEYQRRRIVETGGYRYYEPQTTFNDTYLSLNGNSSSLSGYSTGTSTTYVEKRTPIRHFTYQCTTRFIINSKNIITNYSFIGNDCKQ